MVEVSPLREDVKAPPPLSITWVMTCGFIVPTRWDRVPGRDRAKWTLRHPCHPNGLYGPLGRTYRATTPAPHFPPWRTNRNYRLVTKSVAWTSATEGPLRVGAKRPFRFFVMYLPRAAPPARKGRKVLRREHGGDPAVSAGAAPREHPRFPGARGKGDPGGLRGRRAPPPHGPRPARPPATENGDPRRESPSQRLIRAFPGWSQGESNP